MEPEGSKMAAGSKRKSAVSVVHFSFLQAGL